MALSADFIEAINAPQTDKVFIVLLTLTHPATTDVARLSSDPTQRLGEDPLVYGTISRGQIYRFVPFTVVLPGQDEEAPPLARITVANIDQALIQLIRSNLEPGHIVIEIVLSSNPDVVDRRTAAFEVTNVQYDAFAAQFELRYTPLNAEQFPRHSFTPGIAPGLFP